MKQRERSRYYPQRRRRPARSAIRKKPSQQSCSSRAAAVKPTYFSLLADVEHALKVQHTEGASVQKLKRELEQKYGGRKFDVASTKMLQSAVKRLRNRGRIAKIHPNSSVYRFKLSVVPNNYNSFGLGPTNSRVPPFVGAKPTIGKRSMSMSRSMTISRSGSRSGSGSRPTTRGSMSWSTWGSMSTRSRSPSNSIGKPMSRALSVRKQVSSAKRARAPIRRRW